MVNQCYQRCFSWDSMLLFDIELISIDWLVLPLTTFICGLLFWKFHLLKVFMIYFSFSNHFRKLFSKGLGRAETHWVLTFKGLNLSKIVVRVLGTCWRRCLDMECLGIAFGGVLVRRKRRSGHLHWDHCSHTQTPKQKIMDGWLSEVFVSFIVWFFHELMRNRSNLVVMWFPGLFWAHLKPLFIFAVNLNCLNKATFKFNFFVM